jgi:uncharacterized protein
VRNEVAEPVFVPGRRAGELGYPPVAPSRVIEGDMVVDRDEAVVLQDGVTIYTDIFRPLTETPVPAIIAWSPYAKQELRDDPYAPFPGRAGVPAGTPSRYTKFEGPDPLWWVPKGYAVVNPDSRGSWNCEGDAVFFSDAEGRDIYELVEWLAEQEWCNGRVAMSGVSYLAISQWFAAAEQPPHLACINPWEGVSDVYRDMAFHGGIPETRFLPGFLNYTATSTRMEDMFRMACERPLWDQYWEAKAAQLEKVTVPAYVVASWSDHGLHTRGTLEGFKRISSQQKWLEIHGQKKWEHYYKPESLERQLQFFNHFLMGTDDAVLSWPPVRLEVRERHGVAHERTEREWPPAQTEYVPLYLDAATSRLGESPPSTAGVVRYSATDPAESCVFEHVFESATALAGHMKLRLWVEAEGSDDMDLFVAVEKIDRDGERVGFTYFAAFEDGPVALGWLRVSHREQDEARSTPYQPWLPHTRERRLSPGEVVPVDIEVLPSGTSFEAGERLRLVISAADIHSPAAAGMAHTNTRNEGLHVIHAGGDRQSYLLVPRIPEVER